MRGFVLGGVVCVALATSGVAEAVDRTVTTYGNVTWLAGDVGSTSWVSKLRVNVTDAYGNAVGTIEVERTGEDLAAMHEMLATIDTFASPAIEGALEATAAGEGTFALDEQGSRQVAVASDLFLKAFGQHVFADATGRLAIDDPNDALAPMTLAEGDQVEVFFQRVEGPGWGLDCSQDNCSLDLFGAVLVADFTTKRPALVTAQVAAASYPGDTEPWVWFSSQSIYRTAPLVDPPTGVASFEALAALTRPEKNLKKTVSYDIEFLARDQPPFSHFVTDLWSPGRTEGGRLDTQPITSTVLAILAAQKEAVGADVLGAGTLEALRCASTGLFGLDVDYVVEDRNRDGGIDVAVLQDSGAVVIDATSEPKGVAALEIAEPEGPGAVAILYTASPKPAGQIDGLLVGRLAPTKALIVQRTAEGHAVVEVDLLSGEVVATRYAKEEEYWSFLGAWYDANVYLGYGGPGGLKKVDKPILLKGNL